MYSQNQLSIGYLSLKKGFMILHDSFLPHIVSDQFEDQTFQPGNSPSTLTSNNGPMDIVLRHN